MKSSRLTTYPTTSRQIRCLECEGEGTVEHDVPGGRWNRYIGTWEPDTFLAECVPCHGAGDVESLRCNRCGLATDDADRLGPWDECECTEDELLAWELGDRAPEVSSAAADIENYLRTFDRYGLSKPSSDREMLSRLTSCAIELGDVDDHAASNRLGAILLQLAYTYRPFEPVVTTEPTASLPF